MHEGKKGLLDLHYVNQFILMTKFKYEGINVVPQLFAKGDYFFTFDLKSGYHHVDIHEECWPYLHFYGALVPAENGSHLGCSLFGPASACYVFTNLLCPLVK